MHSSILREAWSPFLGQWDWAWFSTNTFRGPMHPEHADRLWGLWIAKMNDSLHGRGWKRQGKGMFWVRSSEWQQRGALHFHGLLGGQGVGNLDCHRCESQWKYLAGVARLERPRSKDAVQHYLVKHITHGGVIDFGGTPPGLSVEGVCWN